MKIEIKIPSMGESISEASISQILKETGSEVAVDEELIEIETDKVNQVLYATHAGVLELNVKPEDVVKIGQTIGYIDTEGVTQKKDEDPPIKKEEKSFPSKDEIASKNEPAEKTQARVSKEEYISKIKEPPFENKQEKPFTTEQKALALDEEKKSDREEPIKSERESRKKMSRLRQTLAKKLVEVKQQSAMLTTFNEIDMQNIIDLRKKYGENFIKNFDVKLGFMSFFIKAAVSALKAFPEINAYIDQNDIVYRKTFDIGVAVGTEKGLVVPVIKDCDRRSFSNIEKELLSLAKKARDATLTMSDLEGGGFTITNGGIYGSLLSTPILNGNQSGILGMHSIQKRAVVIEDQVVIRPMMYLALSYDHRIVDGKEAVSFLMHIKNLLEDPARMILDI